MRDIPENLKSTHHDGEKGADGRGNFDSLGLSQWASDAYALVRSSRLAALKASSSMTRRALRYRLRQTIAAARAIRLLPLLHTAGPRERSACESHLDSISLLFLDLKVSPPVDSTISYQRLAEGSLGTATRASKAA